jgi:hypothetical protein
MTRAPSIAGLKVKLPDTERCKCGHDIATVGNKTPSGLTQLLCVRCNGITGTMSTNTVAMIAKVSSMFGAPRVISLRRPQPVSRPSSGITQPEVPAR